VVEFIVGPLHRFETDLADTLVAPVHELAQFVVSHAAQDHASVAHHAPQHDLGLAPEGRAPEGLASFHRSIAFNAALAAVA
jgi:hypothetical protein